jgi:hypothetical protein
VRASTKSRIAGQLRALLADQDTDLVTDGLLNRKRSAHHPDDLDVLIQHLAIVMQYLRMDAAATPAASSLIESTCGPDCCKRFTDRDGHKYERWTWFEYNCYERAETVVARLRNMQGCKGGFIFHPKTWHLIGPSTVDSATPLGS